MSERLKCDFCGKEVNSITCLARGSVRICDLCNHLLRQQRLNAIADYDYHTHDGIVLWIKDGKVSAVWTHEGAAGIHLETVRSNVGLQPIDVIGYVRRLLAEEKTTCARCGRVIKYEEVAGHHFAASFCEKCWEVYMQNNSERCKVCGKPRYECTC